MTTIRASITILLILAFIQSAMAVESKIWTFRSDYQDDSWNIPMQPYVATFGRELRQSPENIRAVIREADLAVLKKQASESDVQRVVKRHTMKQLKNNVEADQARSLLIRRGDSIIVKAFKTAAGYADRFGLLAILQLAASIQCDANEECPEHLNSQLDTLLAPGGRFVKTETFYESGVTAWIVAIITYEVKVGDELRVIPLRVRKLPVEVKSLR